jgi:chromosome segregation ATPase
MGKKIVFLVAGVAGLAFLVLGPAAFTHVGRICGNVRAQVADAVPVEHELERAESMIRKIAPEVEKAKRTVAEEQVEITELEQEIGRLERRAEDSGRKVKLQSAALKTGEKAYVVGARSMSRTQLENELKTGFDGLKNDQALLDAKKKLLEARTAALAAAIHKLEVVRAEESNLLTAVEGLRARLRHTQALEACSQKMTLDDGALAQAKDILARCKKRIDVAAKVVEYDRSGSFGGPETESRDVVAEVDAYFAVPTVEAVPASSTTAKSER